MNRIVIIGILLLLLSTTRTVAQNMNSILGYWLDQNEETVVQIYEKNDLYSGRIVWLKDSLDAFGNARRDVLNDEPQLRSRKVLGTDMLIDFAWDGKDTWRKGEIYYYQTGNDYNGKIYLDGGNLKLKGYYSFLFFLGRTKTWERLKDPATYGLR